MKKSTLFSKLCRDPHGAAPGHTVTATYRPAKAQGKSSWPWAKAMRSHDRAPCAPALLTLAQAAPSTAPNLQQTQQWQELWLSHWH